MVFGAKPVRWSTSNWANLNAEELVEGEDVEEDVEEDEEDEASVAGLRSRWRKGLWGCSMWHRGGGNADASRGGSGCWDCRGQAAYEARVTRRWRRWGNDSSGMLGVLLGNGGDGEDEGRGGRLGAGSLAGAGAGGEGEEEEEGADGREDGLKRLGDRCDSARGN